jgi:hypothetical protein
MIITRYNGRVRIETMHWYYCRVMPMLSKYPVYSEGIGHRMLNTGVVDKLVTCTIYYSTGQPNARL